MNDKTDKPKTFVVPDEPKYNRCPIVRLNRTVGRNEKCPYCSSGLKFKRCCGGRK